MITTISLIAIFILCVYANKIQQKRPVVASICIGIVIAKLAILIFLD